MPDLIITLILGAYVFAAGGYVFTFKYLQSTAKALWTGIRELDERLRVLRENDLHALEQRLERLERGR